MGFFKDILGALGIGGKQYKYADIMSGRTPIYSTFGRNIYASDVVVQATKCVTDEIMKLSPTHIRRKGADILPAADGDNIQWVLNNPNHYMTTADFLSKVMYTYFQKSNSWVIPTYTVNERGRRRYTGLYPVDPQQVTFEEDANGRLLVYLQFTDSSFDIRLPYSDVIHLKRNYGAAEYMGGGADGMPDDTALLATLDINHQMLQNMGRAMKASQAVNGVVKYAGVLGKNETEAAIAEFEAKLQSSTSGILPMDMKGEYIPITREIKMVDADTLKFIDEKILRNFRVSINILSGDFDKEDFEAFFQTGVEPIQIQLGQEFTRVLFTPDQRAHKNEIVFYEKELIFMSIDQKINTINLLAPTGALFENEKRVAFGWRPLPELVGKRYLSLNWIEAGLAAEYQTGKETNTDPAAGGAENE